MSEAALMRGGMVVAAYLAYLALGLLHSFYAFFLRPGKKLSKFGKWAVVTGATDGIGEAMAMRMAAKGLSIVLISRTEAKLKETEGKIKEKYPNVEVSYIVVDFSNFDEAAQARVKGALAGLDVGVLVNNVGVSYSFCRYFHELTPAEVDALVELNVNSTTRMTYLVLPGMIERKRGAIVNMSSGAARNPSPLLAGYAGAKGFIEHFSESLHQELKSKGVHVQVQSPLFVVSKLSKIRKASLSAPTPKAFATAAVNHIGYEAKVSPYWAHAVQLTLARNIPAWVFEKFIIMPMHLGIRQKGLKKLAKAAEEGKK